MVQNGSWSPSHHIHILVSMTEEGELVTGQKGTSSCGISLLYTAFLEVSPNILLELKNTVSPNYKEGWKMEFFNWAHWHPKWNGCSVAEIEMENGFGWELAVSLRSHTQTLTDTFMGKERVMRKNTGERKEEKERKKSRNSRNVKFS